MLISMATEWRKIVLRPISMLKMNLDGSLLSKTISISFRKEIFTAKVLADTDKSQRPEFINALFNRLNNRPESDARFFSRIGFNQEKRSDLLRYGTGRRSTNGLHQSVTSPLMIWSLCG